MKQYPDDEDLKRIREWDIRDPFGLIEFIESIGWCDPVRRRGRRVWYVEFHTWGWSGNEDIISALQSNYLFWSLYWEKSVRGGHYYFRVYKLKSKTKL